MKFPRVPVKATLAVNGFVAAGLLAELIVVYGRTVAWVIVYEDCMLHHVAFLLHLLHPHSGHLGVEALIPQTTE